MEWYYAVGGQRVGPVSQADFDRLVHEGVIKPDTLVWRQGMAGWQPHSSSSIGVVPDGSPPQIDDGTEVCAVSGKRYPRREMIQFEGRWISAEHRDAFFQRMREGVVQPGHFVYAGFWLRFVAKFIDTIVLTVVTMVLNMILAIMLLGSANYFTAKVNAENLAPFLIFQGVTMVVNIAITLGYTLFFVRRFSATPGKMALGLKLVRADGSALSKARITGRYFAEWISWMILLIGYIIAAFDEQKRALHDHICDTRVIRG